MGSTLRSVAAVAVPVLLLLAVPQPAAASPDPFRITVNSLNSGQCIGILQPATGFLEEVVRIDTFSLTLYQFTADPRRSQNPDGTWNGYLTFAGFCQTLQELLDKIQKCAEEPDPLLCLVPDL